MNDAFIFVQLLQFQGLGIVGSKTHCHALLRHLNKAESTLKFISSTRAIPARTEMTENVLDNNSYIEQGEKLKEIKSKI